MAMRGERFELDLDPEDAYLESQQAASPEAQPKGSLGFDFVKDVLERKPAAPKPPAPPRLKQTASGFPEHKKRTGQSRFKQSRAGNDGAASKPAPSSKSATKVAASGKYLSSIANASLDEQKSIDQQNTQMIANMSAEELAEARSELLSESSVNIIRRLMQRSTIDDQNSKAATSTSSQPTPAKPAAAAKEKHISESAGTKKSVSFAATPAPHPAARTPVSRFDEDKPPLFPPADLHDVTSSHPLADPTNLLAPKQGSDARPSKPPPALDPSSASFLSDLHSTYFPDLPNDPNQLAWMAPLPEEKEAKPTSQASTGTPPAELRFDFRGSIITPEASEKIPVNLGLHHHGRDPGKAGYTINELAIYARSTLAAQRCFAYQLLGRVLFRLGQGEFGSEQSEMVKGLYDEIKMGYILDQLLKEASREPGSGNESARVWALEAVWLWRKGGGKGLDDVTVEEEYQGDEVMGDAAGAILEEGLN